MAKQEDIKLAGGATKIMPCVCEHAFQDKKYGKGRRVFNKGASQYICTVCLQKRT